MKFNRLSDLIATNQLQNKRVFIRADFNVPQDNIGNISEDTKIRLALPAISQARKAGAAIMLSSHLGRPIEGTFTQKYSLLPIAHRLTELLNIKVPLISNWINGVDIMPGQIILLENCRFNKGETSNQNLLAQKIAKLCDIYVNDAFGAAHRVEATTYGIAKFARICCAGPLLTKELDILNTILTQPIHPLVAIVAGSKVSTKLLILQTLSKKIDQLIIGGGIANTFMLASGFKIGKSLIEINLINEAKKIIKIMANRGASILIPIDVVCSKTFLPNAKAIIKNVQDITDDDIVLDIGPKTSAFLVTQLTKAGTIIWNGPVGVFEFNQFSTGTETLARAIANSKAFSIAGGGDTIAAIRKYNIFNKINYISTGGGAFLEFLGNKTLPAVQILMQRALI